MLLQVAVEELELGAQFPQGQHRRHELFLHFESGIDGNSFCSNIVGETCAELCCGIDHIFVLKTFKLLTYLVWYLFCTVFRYHMYHFV